MPYKNRVDPTGELRAEPSRCATLMGNRGCLHDSARHVIKQRTPSRRWIACTMEEKFGKRKLLEPGNYTELFFLDEATALSAGHRPCAQCRRADFKSFVEAWRSANLPGISAGDIDAVLDRERRTRHPAEALTSNLTEGLIVQRVAEAGFFLVYKGEAHPWSFAGYAGAIPLPELGTQVQVVTLPSMCRVLEAGYACAVHPSAQAAPQWYHSPLVVS